jgi:vacuolar protein-sorting-associated protein 4
MIPQAIEIISKAIEADTAGEYEKALGLYRDALARFTIGLKYEKNDAKKRLILERVDGYMSRAEELSEYVKKQHELDKGGGGGVASKSKGDGEEEVDAEKKKLRGALAGAIVTEKPNIKWDDVAGLANAKESLKEVSVLEARRCASMPVALCRALIRDWHLHLPLILRRCSTLLPTEQTVILPTKFPQLFTGKRKPFKGILLCKSNEVVDGFGLRFQSFDCEMVVEGNG